MQGAIVFPAAGYIEMASAAAELICGTRQWVVEELEFRKALVVQEDKIPILQSTVHQDTGEFRIRSRAGRVDSDWTVHVVGKIGTGAKAPPPPMAIGDLKQKLTLRINKTKHYENVTARDFTYGPAFQGVELVFAGDGEAIGEITLPPALLNGLLGYFFHPALLDACIQTIFGLLSVDEAMANNATYLRLRLTVPPLRQ